MRRKIIVCLLLLLTMFYVHAEEKQSLYLNLSFYNFSYFFFTLDAGYRSQEMLIADGMPLQLNAYLRSYGLALYKLEGGVQELSASGELYFPAPDSGFSQLTPFVTAGLILRLNSHPLEFAIQPIAGGGIRWEAGGFRFRLPAYIRFYTDGFSTVAVPEISCSIGTVRLFTTLETALLTRYNFSAAELRSRISVGSAFEW